MAKAEKNSNVTWIWVREAYPAILRLCGSPQLCSAWLAEGINSGQIRWKYQAPPIVDAQNFWRPTADGKFPEIDFEQNLATRLVVADTPGVYGMVHETIYGLAIAKEHLEALGAEMREDDNLSPSSLLRSLVSGLRDADDRWPWDKDPSLRAKGGEVEVRRCQMTCERKLDPAVRHLSTSKICKALEDAGAKGAKGFSESTVKRAFGRIR
jgi:hypothetical protein